MKLADILHNVEDIARNDPDFARLYVREKELSLTVLTDGDAMLHQRASELIARSKTELGLDEDT